jgi:hypothetical protein
MVLIDPSIEMVFESIHVSGPEWLLVKGGSVFKLIGA